MVDERAELHHSVTPTVTFVAVEPYLDVKWARELSDGPDCRERLCDLEYTSGVGNHVGVSSGEAHEGLAIGIFEQNDDPPEPWGEVWYSIPNGGVED